MQTLSNFHEALSELITNTPSPEIECFRVEESRQKILASSIFADLDLPPFDRSTMDGYAVRSQDLVAVPATLKILGEAPAGTVFQETVQEGYAVRIMTGAGVPPGADSVQMVEKTRRVGDGSVEILEGTRRGQNIVYRGSEVQSGTVILEKGRTLGPAEIGVLAAFGRETIEVFRAPSVTIVTTGDELVGIDAKPGPGQIRDSNRYMLKAQCEALGVAADAISPLLDNWNKTVALLEELRDRDILIFSGGVSMGERDFIHQVIKRSDARLVFHKVAVKPGKPILYARRGKQMIFGLPGNPVSSFVSFELFVRPAVRKLMGSGKPYITQLDAILMHDILNTSDRLFFGPGRLQKRGSSAELIVDPIPTKGSGDLVAFSPANCLIAVPAAKSRLRAGQLASVVVLEAFFQEGTAHEAFSC
jgi:molybdopterin molybdotransferase